MKNLKQVDIKENILSVVRTELQWPIESSALQIITSNIANFVYTFSFNNEKYFVKFFPDFFKSNNFVAKPDGSFYRESFVYELTTNTNYAGVPKLVHKSETSPILITKEWGYASLVETICSYSVQEACDEIMRILVVANKLQNLFHQYDSIVTAKERVVNFSDLQRKYLIRNPIEHMNLHPSEINEFWKDYLSLNAGLVLGDLSLKNVLIKGNEVGLCDFESIFLAPRIFDTCYLIADVLNNLEKTNRQEFISEIHNIFYPRLSSEEQKVFFRLLSICISYRNISRLQTKLSNVEDVKEAQAIFYM